MRFFLTFTILFTTLFTQGQDITKEQAEALCKPAMHCIQKPYPYKTGYVLGSASDVLEPKEKHPAFYGCFDWHSSVHGHWTLVTLLKQYPELEHAAQIKTMLSENLCAENIAKEVQLFSDPNNKNFERPYGWAWLLKLSLELKTWDDPTGKKLASNLQPLSDTIVAQYKVFLSKLNYPIRVGEHSNTAFGLTFAWDYANEFGDYELKNLIEDKAREFYMKDAGCPISWEPGGFDFLSPCLIEADLMTRVLNDTEYKVWLNRFLPGLAEGRLTLEPAQVADRNDGKMVHLDGLNLSRTWCLLNINHKLGDNNQAIIQLANQHLNSALPHINSGAYEGEHWLASFAVYALRCQ